MNKRSKPDKLIIAITFHYIEERLLYLHKITSHFKLLAKELRVFIITNTKDINHHDKIIKATGNDFNAQIVTPKLLGHPYLLTWCHLEIFRRHFNSDEKISHFMYLEDDIHITEDNISYWLNGREDLRKFKLIPSFLRFELKTDVNEAYSTDVTKALIITQLPRIQISEKYKYINLPQPYQGMYLLDRELMEEHLSGKSSSPEFGIWGIREKAAQGLTFSNIPEGCFSRNFIGFDDNENEIDKNCLIHHTPNNYANDPDTVFGKIKIKDLIAV